MRGAVLGLALFLAACGGEGTVAAAPAPQMLVASADEGTITLEEMTVPARKRVLAEGFGATRAPALHHEGKRYCFVARSAALDASWRIYVADLSGTTPQPIDADVDAASTPAWLPDGRIVFDAPADDASRALFVVDPEDGQAERITFGGPDARDPCVLEDGRVLYAGSRTTSAGDAAPGLFTVHPDGTGVLLFHGATPGEAYLRPTQQVDGDVRFFVRRGEAVLAFLADWRAPHTEAVSCDARLERDRCTVARRPRPQGHMSMLAASKSKTAGTLLCMDARRGVAAAADFVRLYARAPQGAAGTLDWQELGRVSLKPDGSFFATVPADTPLRVDVHAADGTLLKPSYTPFWVRAGETRGCTGCHEDPDVTPPNRQPLAVLETAVVPQRPAREGGR